MKKQDKRVAVCDQKLKLLTTSKNLLIDISKTSIIIVIIIFVFYLYMNIILGGRVGKGLILILRERERDSGRRDVRGTDHRMCKHLELCLSESAVIRKGT